MSEVRIVRCVMLCNVYRYDLSLTKIGVICGVGSTYSTVCNFYRYDFSLTQIGVICGAGSTYRTVCNVV